MAAKECTALVVDDDGSVLNSLRRLLESAGYGTMGFGSANELSASGLVENACCLILDIKPPGMSGFELQEYLTALHTPIPVIFITGHDRPGMEEQALRLGAVPIFASLSTGRRFSMRFSHSAGKEVLRQHHNASCPLEAFSLTEKYCQEEKMKSIGKIFLLVLLAVGILALTAMPAAAQEKKPSILFIMGDDIGWMQPSIYHLALGQIPRHVG